MTQFKSISLILLTLTLILTSCSKEDEFFRGHRHRGLKATDNSGETTSRASLMRSYKNASKLISWRNKKVKTIDNFSVPMAVNPTACGPTAFRGVIANHNDALVFDFLSIWDGTSDDPIFVIFEDYPIINTIAALLEGKNDDSFGADGEYTRYVNNEMRSLEKFWDMANLIEVHGQHTATLEDLDFIRHVYENYSSATPDLIDHLVAIAEEFNQGDQIPENPLFAADGFATFDGHIVIGDGIVSMLAELGFDPKVVWSSILAHEWAHQIQFAYFSQWTDYPVPQFIGTPESTRMTELEADFFTGYYLTDKRGGTFNWKRVEDFLSTFFEIGDCGFDSPGHHGTPDQRLEAAYEGFKLADDMLKKGHVLSATEVHQAFLESLPSIVD